MRVMRGVMRREHKNKFMKCYNKIKDSSRNGYRKTRVQF